MDEFSTDIYKVPDDSFMYRRSSPVYKRIMGGVLNGMAPGYFRDQPANDGAANDGESSVSPGIGLKRLALMALGIPFFQHGGFRPHGMPALVGADDDELAIPVPGGDLMVPLGQGGTPVSAAQGRSANLLAGIPGVPPPPVAASAAPSALPPPPPAPGPAIPPPVAARPEPSMEPIAPVRPNVAPPPAVSPALTQAMDRYNQLASAPPPKPKWWEKVLAAAGSTSIGGPAAAFNTFPHRQAAHQHRLQMAQGDVEMQRAMVEDARKQAESNELINQRKASAKASEAAAGASNAAAVLSNARAADLGKPKDPPDTRTPDRKNYEFAVGEGYVGSFTQWLREQANLRAESPRGLRFEEHADENTGNVTVIGRDPLTGQEKSRAVEKGVAKKRPTSAEMQSGHALHVPIPAHTGQGKNEEVLNRIPAGQRGIVKQLVEYRIPLPIGRTLLSPYWQGILEAAAAYDPSFDASQYNIRMGVRRDFTSGKTSQTITRMNQVVGHLDKLDKASDALDNTSFQTWNTVGNMIEKEFGSPAITNYNLAANAVESELVNIFKGTGATDQEIRAWRENLNSSASPEQLKGAVNTALDLLISRVIAVQDQYERGMGRPKDFRIFGKEARALLKRLGQDPDELDPVSGQEGGVDQRPIVVTVDGKEYTFPTQEAANAFSAAIAARDQESKDAGKR